MNREQRSRRCRPRLEGLEPRALLSTLHVVGPAPGSHSADPYLNLIVAKESATGQGAADRAAADGSGSSAATPPWVSQAVLQQVAASLYAPITTTTTETVNGQTFPPGTYSVPQPTKAEIRRETFWMEFVGHYYVGAPRFSDQSATIHIYSNGRDVTSNQSLNARAELLLLPPADPSASPTTSDPMAGQVAGLLSMFPSNALQSGSSFFGDVTNLPGAPSNATGVLDNGLPTHVGFTLDPGGVTGGVYAVTAYNVLTPSGQTSPIIGANGGAVSIGGAGEIDIKYLPSGHSHGGASRSGTAIVRVQGLLNLTGVTNPLYKGIN